MMLSLYLAWLPCVLSAPTPADFEIKSLPGLEKPLNFKQYSGYMPIGDEKGTEMFFWFVESQRNPSSDPVAFWTNGGPGASSVAYGFWTEHGPFRLSRNASGAVVPQLYDYAWNREASVVYLEMPSGVGFSFSKDTTAYENITDAQAADQSFRFLQAFFNTFSSFKSNPFYVTGESYGGHYVPNLSERILDAGSSSGINMKGFLIGNPGINSDWYFNVDEYAFVTYMWSHGLIPAPVYQRAFDACGWADFFTNCSKDFTHPSKSCRDATQEAVNLVPTPLDFYDILVPTCHDSDKQSVGMTHPHMPFLRHMRDTYGLDLGGASAYDPCLSALTSEYINQPNVLAAINAKANPDRKWPGHPSNWGYNQGVEGEKKNIALLFPKFFAGAPDWKIWVVSGTADSAVPFLGTERWMNCLGRKVTSEWQPWLLNKDVAGVVKQYDGMAFVTVKGCGHTIPTYCPEAGYQFFANYLAA